MSLPQIDTTALFDVAGKSAIVVGATGAFGKVVCATLGKAGARLTITAGNASELSLLEKELQDAGMTCVPVNRRPNSEADCKAIVDAAVSGKKSWAACFVLGEKGKSSGLDWTRSEAEHRYTSTGIKFWRHRGDGGVSSGDRSECDLNAHQPRGIV